MHYHLRVGSDITNWERLDQFCWAISRAAVWSGRLSRLDIHPVECHQQDCFALIGIENYVLMHPEETDKWTVSSI